ncbi:energy transducer [Stappia sp. 22II-S9-Z10]|nr:energy transducer [Stappia sp. 22II-S9-Z10]
MTPATASAAPVHGPSILDAGGLNPPRLSRTAGRSAWVLAVLLAVALHLAFVLRFDPAPAEEQVPEEKTSPITMSDQTVETLLGEEQAPEEEAEETAAPETGAPAPAAQGSVSTSPGEIDETSDAPTPNEEFDVPDVNAVFNSLEDGVLSNPRDTAADSAPSAAAASDDAAGEATDAAPAEPVAAETAEASAQETDTAAQDAPPGDAPVEGPAQDGTGTEAAPADAVADAAPSLAPTPSPSPASPTATPSPAAPSLPLPDISAAFDAASGADPDLAAALPEVAAEAAAQQTPDAAGAAASAAAIPRPDDPSFPVPFARPEPGARTPTFSAAQAGALERVPLPAANPAPAAERAAATPQNAAPARPAATAAQQPGPGDGAQASYARAVRAIVGRAFFSAARDGQIGTGTAVVTITIGRDGRFVDARLAQSSGNPLLDNAVLSAAFNDFPAFPASVADETISISVPIRVR